MLLLTEQLNGDVLAPPDTEDNVQEPEVKVIDEGKTILIFEIVGIECYGYMVIAY